MSYLRGDGKPSVMPVSRLQVFDRTGVELPHIIVFTDADGQQVFETTEKPEIISAPVVAQSKKKRGK
jgi:hypothetical protein